jgi:SnoaL-like domain
MAEGELAILLAKQAITEQIYSYCRSMDRIDNELGKGVWHPHGTADFGELYAGSGAGWIDQVSVQHATGWLSTSHMVSNIMIRVDGDTAASESYIHAVLQSAPSDELRTQLTVRGRYLDRWSRRDGRWSIDHRLLLIDLASTGEVSGEGSFFDPWGSRGKDDPSYQYL